MFLLLLVAFLVLKPEDIKIIIKILKSLYIILQKYKKILLDELNEIFTMNDLNDLKELDKKIESSQDINLSDLLYKTENFLNKNIHNLKNHNKNKNNTPVKQADQADKINKIEYIKNKDANEINFYIIKILELGLIYDGPYSLPNIKNFYYMNVIKLSKNYDSTNNSNNDNKEKNDYFYITTPIYYANSNLHIGHAYTTVIADCIARFQKLQGKKVKFLTGSDEHGEKIQKASQKLNVTPQKLVDDLSLQFKDLFAKLHIEYDIFLRTSSENHKDFVQICWNKLTEKGLIYKGYYEGWYSTTDETFYDEHELIDGLAPTGATVAFIKEPTYFFKLSQYTDFLLGFYKNNPSFIYPENKLKEIINFVSNGLKDLSVSRCKKDFTWGIEVPNNNDNGSDNAETHIIYVWLDALLNYASGLNTKLENINQNTFWPVNLHVMGKDIVRFHSIYWPAFLHALDLELPRKIISHGWWLNDSQKMSKSLDNVINPLDLIELTDSDGLRYFLLRDLSFNNDGDFTEQKLCDRYTKELSNKLGNLVQRVYIFTKNKFNLFVPKISFNENLKISNIEQNDIDIIYLQEIILNLLKTKDQFIVNMNNNNLHSSLDIIFNFLDDANAYMEEKAPWRDKENANIIIYTLLESLRYIAVMLFPFIPIASEKIANMLGFNIKDVNIFEFLDKKNALIQEKKLNEISILFKKL